jgi:anti-sigma regulatory factor (Ser/Thr protein kinase)
VSTGGDHRPHPTASNAQPVQFEAADLATLRHAVRAQARTCGLPRAAADDFVLAVNEITTNAVVHGGGRGQLLLWCDDATLRCRIRDWGPGFADEPIPHPPPASAANGRGIWITQLLCHVQVHAALDGGTIVELSVPCPHRPDHHDHVCGRVSVARGTETLPAVR